MLRALSLLVLLVLCACGEPPAPGGTDSAFDSAGVRVVDLVEPLPEPRPLALDPAWRMTGELELGSLDDVEPLPDGRVALLDAMNARVLVLGPDGASQSTFGREGEGPGELAPRMLSWVVATDSTLLVPDLDLGRITEFRPDGTLVGTRSFVDMGHDRPGVFGVDWRTHPSGGLVYRELRQDGDLLLHAHRSRIDTLLVLEMPPGVPNLLLPPTGVWDVDPAGRTLVGRTDTGRTELRVPGEPDPVWIVRRDGAVRPVEEDDRAHLRRLLLESADRQGLGALPEAERERILGSVRFPERVPVIAGALAAPGGRFWVQRAAPIARMGIEAMRVGTAVGFGAPIWEVLAEDGRLVETVRLPEGFTPTRFSGACLYGILEDDLGLPAPRRVCPEG